MTLRSELPRKVVHISMGGFALLLRWLTPWQALLMAVAALVLNLFFLHRLTGRRLLRPEERETGFSAGIVIYPAVLLGVFVVFQSRLELAAGVWALMAVGDGMATVSGLAIGGPRLPWNAKKTWSGLGAFVLLGAAACAFLIRWTQRARGATAVWPEIEVTWVGGAFLSGGLVDAGGFTFLLLGCLAAAAAAALAESLETSVDDNILVPVVGGAVLLAATLVDPSQLDPSQLEGAPVLARGLALGLAVTAPFAVLAYATRSVDRTGAFAGTLVGTLLYALAGWPGFALLILLVVGGVGVTRLGHSRKAALGIAQEKEGRRGAGSAFANTGAGVAFGFLAMATPFRDLFTLAMVAAFATAIFDTTASEVGKAYGRRHRLVTTLHSVPAGTAGAVSLEGTAAGAVAAVAMAVLASTVGLITIAGAMMAVLGAFLGSTVESFIGAVLGGRRGSDNELLNLTNTVVGAAMAVALYVAFF